jgi:hypothetical protein
LNNQDRFPPGWDAERVRSLLAHYECQSDVEAVAEDEAAWDVPGQTALMVPTELVPAINALIAKRRARKRS